jgi:hypothetical protein
MHSEMAHRLSSAAHASEELQLAGGRRAGLLSSCTRVRSSSTTLVARCTTWHTPSFCGEHAAAQ